MNFDPYILDIEYIQECAEKIGKTNVMYNPYNFILQKHQEYVDLGLTPEIYVEPITNRLYITTEEYRTGKFH